MTPVVPPDGFRHLPEYFDRGQQERLVDTVLSALNAANTPFYQPTMPRTGAPLSVLMSNLGPLGWVTDKDGGYRYEPRHPETGAAWPAIPDTLMDLWARVAGAGAPEPQACLVNWYRAESKMGLHVDWDEEATDVAVVSVSLGDPARFRVGGSTRGGKTVSLKLSSGDVVVLGGAARRAYHGVDRIYAGGSSLLTGRLERGGRLNLTLRRVTRP